MVGSEDRVIGFCQSKVSQPHSLLVRQMGLNTWSSIMKTTAAMITAANDAFGM